MKRVRLPSPHEYVFLLMGKKAIVLIFADRFDKIVFGIGNVLHSYLKYLISEMKI